MDAQQELQWLKKIQSAVDKLLEPIIPNQQTRNKYLTKEAMVIWSLAFTHESYSTSENFERLEYLGDAILKAMFPKYLMKRFPHYNQDEYTKLNIAYMSKTFQAQLGTQLGFGGLVRFLGVPDATHNIIKDVFESFFGALDTVSDMIVPGLGFSNCYNMVMYLFSTIEIDEKKRFGDKKTQVIQIFKRFDLREPTEEKDKMTNTCIILLEEEHINFLSRFGLNIKSNVTIPTSRGAVIIGYETGKNTLKESEVIAYSNAFNYLESLGITIEWAENTKIHLDFIDPSIREYTSAANDRLIKEGYKGMYFLVIRKLHDATGVTVQLVGCKDDGFEVILQSVRTTESANSYRTGKTQAIRQYAEGY